MAVSRRGFFQFLAGGAGSLMVGGAALKEAADQVFPRLLPARSLAPTHQKWVMVIDLAQCDGCGDCTWACNAMHFVPPHQEWIRVYQVSDNPVAGSYFL